MYSPVGGHRSCQPEEWTRKEQGVFVFCVPWRCAFVQLSNAHGRCCARPNHLLDHHHPWRRQAHVNLKVKVPFKVRGRKHAFEINKHSYLGSTDSGRSPKDVLMRRQRPGVLRRTGMTTSGEGRHFHWCRGRPIVMLILNHVFSFQSCDPQSRSHHSCPLVTPGSQGGSGSVRGDFAPFQKFEASGVQGSPSRLAAPAPF